MTIHPDEPYLPDYPDEPLILGREDLFRLLKEYWERDVPFDLRSVQLSETDLLSGRFFTLDFSRVLAQGYRFSHPQGRALFLKVCFREALPDEADFTNCTFRACSFRDASLWGANLSGALFSHNIPLGFLYANFSEADLSSVSMEGADFRGAKLNGIHACRATLAYSDFRGSCLSRADLSEADLTGCDFSGADLSYANLSAATIEGCDFTGANLTGNGLERVLEQRRSQAHACVRWWRTDDLALPLPSSHATLNFPYERTLTKEEEEEAYAEYVRYYEEHGLTDPEQVEEAEADTKEKEKPVFNKSIPQQSEELYLPDFPDEDDWKLFSL